MIPAVAGGAVITSKTVKEFCVGWADAYRDVGKGSLNNNYPFWNADPSRPARRLDTQKSVVIIERALSRATHGAIADIFSDFWSGI